MIGSRAQGSSRIRAAKGERGVAGDRFDIVSLQGGDPQTRGASHRKPGGGGGVHPNRGEGVRMAMSSIARRAALTILAAQAAGWIVPVAAVRAEDAGVTTSRPV